jgi:hypothetical protein
VETGSFVGEGIQTAIDAGFLNIFSVELSPKLYKMCSDRFEKNSTIKLFLGDVVDCLPTILEKIDMPATFWLDAHYSGDGTAQGIHGDPIYKELEIIAMHSIKNHTILIDDMRLYNKFYFETLVKKINPLYTITYDEGFIKNDILVACLKSF